MEGDGGGSDGGSELVPGWTITVLLLIFVALGLLVELGFHLLLAHLDRVKKNALVEVVQHVKNELLLVGFVALFLSVFGELLADVCYNDGSSEKDTAARRLLSDQEGPCSYGQKQMFPYKLQHEAHIFMFTTAITHIVYTTLMVAGAKFMVGQWVKWERMCQEDPVPNDRLPDGRFARLKHVLRQRLRLGRPWEKFLLAPVIAVWGVDFETYRHIRALIVIELPLWPNAVPLLEDMQTQNVHARFVDALEYEMADIIRVNWWLWLGFLGLMAIPDFIEYVIWAMIIVAAVALIVTCAQLVYCMAMLRRTSSRRMQHVSHANLSVSDEAAWQKGTGAWQWFTCCSGDQDKSVKFAIGQSAGLDARELKREIIMDEFLGNAVLEKAAFFRMHQLKGSKDVAHRQVSDLDFFVESPLQGIAESDAAPNSNLPPGLERGDAQGKPNNKQDSFSGFRKAIGRACGALERCLKKRTPQASTLPEATQEPAKDEQHQEGWWADFLAAVLWHRNDRSMLHAVERFRDDYPQPLVHTNSNSHLWFKSLTLTLRLLQIVFFENAFSIAVSAYSLFNLHSYRQGNTTLSDNLIFKSYAEASAVIVCDVVMLVFGSAILLPMFALIAPLSSQCNGHVFKRGINTLQFQHDLKSVGGSTLDEAIKRLDTMQSNSLKSKRLRSALSEARAPIVAAVADANSLRMRSMVARMCSGDNSGHLSGHLQGSKSMCARSGLNPVYTHAAYESSDDLPRSADAARRRPSGILSNQNTPSKRAASPLSLTEKGPDSPAIAVPSSSSDVPDSPPADAVPRSG